jgi:NAD(P)-dependent dehydrogenase (short-subunit alcohol dehydrogenase family)
LEPDIAGTAVFLTSDDQFVTGGVLCVDGVGACV